jgi:hypothetical protein
MVFWRTPRGTRTPGWEPLNYRHIKERQKIINRMFIVELIVLAFFEDDDFIHIIPVFNVNCPFTAPWRGALKFNQSNGILYRDAGLM